MNATFYNMVKKYYVYILTNKNDTVLYVGVTNDLQRRISEHRSRQCSGFSKSYNLNKLVYYETFLQMKVAIQLEKRIKKWNRSWKNELINQLNPTWIDLSTKIE